MNLDTRKFAQSLKDAQVAHHEYETLLGHPDPNWAEWYADYITMKWALEEFNKKDDPTHKLIPYTHPPMEKRFD